MSAKCEIAFRASGKWWVSGRELHIEVLRSENTRLVPVPYHLIDLVLRIDDQEKVLRSKTLRMPVAYRVKKDICLQ